MGRNIRVTFFTCQLKIFQIATYFWAYHESFCDCYLLPWSLLWWSRFCGPKEVAKLRPETQVDSWVLESWKVPARGVKKISLSGLKCLNITFPPHLKDETVFSSFVKQGEWKLCPTLVLHTWHVWQGLPRCPNFIIRQYRTHPCLSSSACVKDAGNCLISTAVMVTQDNAFICELCPHSTMIYFLSQFFQAWIMTKCKNVFHSC